MRTGASAFSLQEERARRHESASPRLADHRGVHRRHAGDRLLDRTPRLEESAQLLPRRKRDPLVSPRRVECVGHVRHQWDDVVGLPAVRLRAQEHLDSVALARVQPDFPHGLPLRLAPALRRHDRCGVDQVPVRREPRCTPRPYQRRRLRDRERDRISRLRLRWRWASSRGPSCRGSCRRTRS